MTSDKFSTSGLGGVWAEENTREAIFAAMQRKETFGTSGVRIKVRLLRRLGLRAQRPAKQGLGQDRLRERRAHGRRPAGRQVEGADVHRLGRQGSRRRQSRSHPDRQGLDAERADLREDLQRRLVEPQGAERRTNLRCAGAPRPGRAPAGGQYGRRQERDVHQHHRGGRVEDGLDGPGLRPEPIRVLLRAGAADPDTALDDVRREEARRPAAEQRSRDGSGPRVDFADLVFAER